MLSNGTISTITCNESSNLRFETIGYVQINALEFIGCSNRFEAVNQLLIINTSFIGSGHMDGTALLFIESNITITLSNFSNNHGGKMEAVQTLDYLKYEQNTEITTNISCGGAIIATQSNVTVTHCIFEMNSAVIGGAMFVHKGSKITIFATVFDTNWARGKYAMYFGGAVYADTSLDNTTSFKAEVMVLESNFSNNTAA